MLLCFLSYLRKWSLLSEDEKYSSSIQRRDGLKQDILLSTGVKHNFQWYSMYIILGCDFPLGNIRACHIWSAFTYRRGLSRRKIEAIPERQLSEAYPFTRLLILSRRCGPPMEAEAFRIQSLYFLYYNMLVISGENFTECSPICDDQLFRFWSLHRSFSESSSTVGIPMLL